MANLTSVCPRCGADNYVYASPYLRVDGGATIHCERCGQRFWAKLTPKDIEFLFTNEKSPTTPVIEGKWDYILESEFLPIQ